MTAVLYLRSRKDLEKNHAVSCLEFSTCNFLFLREIAFGVAADCWLAFCFVGSYEKVTGRFPGVTSRTLHSLLVAQGGCNSARHLKGEAFNDYTRGYASPD